MNEVQVHHPSVMFEEAFSALPIRTPTPCGTDDNIAAGREPTQSGWYDWIGQRVSGSVLDVGAGMCVGMDAMRIQNRCVVTGIDNDIRLAGRDPSLLIGDIAAMPDDSFDYVTAIDVIEHVVEDVLFFRHLIRIARKGVYISTPHVERSECLNHYHCREYRIVDFIELFKPDEVWCASPDGWLNHTRVWPSLELNLVFIGDGKVWAHFCAFFHASLHK